MQHSTYVTTDQEQHLDNRMAVARIVVATAWLAFATTAWCGPHEDAAAAYQRGDYAAAFNNFKALADDGDAHAQYMLGLMYHDGQGISPNENAAFGWFRKAAEQGNADAENYIGYMYTNGQGVAEDRVAGFTWLHKAALQGNATAQYRLGIAYVDGKGVAQDDARAVTWFRKAAAQGNADAQFWLGLSYDQAAGVPQDYAAADQGNGMAQYAVGLMYYNAHGVQKDLVQAYRWFTLSAARESDLRADASGMLKKAASEMTPAQIATAQKSALEGPAK
jgi:TPR repeat protein